MEKVSSGTREQSSISIRERDAFNGLDTAYRKSTAVRPSVRPFVWSNYNNQLPRVRTTVGFIALFVTAGVVLSDIPAGERNPPR